MKDYIEREKVLKDLLDQCKITGYGGLTPSDVKYVFSLQINADVMPVVRGEWITPPKNRDYAHMIDYYECPFCGYIEDCLVNFCPNCAADLRGEKE